MKFRIVSPDARAQIDPPLRDQLLSFLDQSDSSDLALVPVTYHFDYRFNDALRSIGRYVLVDMTEQGWDWNQKSENRLGKNAMRNYTHFDTDEWGKLDDFIGQNPPLLTFKRELLKKDVSPTMKPIEHLCIHPIPGVQSKAEFDARPVDVFHVWGWSHPARAILHADIFRAMTTHGIEVISEFRHFDAFKPTPPAQNLWAAIYAPWFCRTPLEDILHLQQRCKLSVSMPGAGRKCFRHAQSPSGSIMALSHDDIAWTYPWLSGLNCVRFETISDLVKHLERNDLYEIYLGSQKTISHYQSQTYIRDYFIPAIESVL